MEHRHFFIAGAQRCATTYLYRLLDQHPAITMARPMRPEPKYFIRHATGDGAAEYRREFFPGATTLWLGEKSTSYIELPHAAERIAKLLPDAHAFFILRDPVERAISNYQFSVANGRGDLSLEDALDAESSRVSGSNRDTSVSPFAYVGRGHYARQLDAWAALFPRARMHVVTTEQLVGDTMGALRRILDVLQLEAAIPPNGIGDAVNASGHTQGEVRAGTRERLRGEFFASNRDLASRYGVDTGSWQ